MPISNVSKLFQFSPFSPRNASAGVTPQQTTASRIGKFLAPARPQTPKLPLLRSAEQMGDFNIFRQRQQELTKQRDKEAGGVPYLDFIREPVAADYSYKVIKLATEITPAQRKLGTPESAFTRNGVKIPAGTYWSVPSDTESRGAQMLRASSWIGLILTGASYIPQNLKAQAKIYPKGTIGKIGNLFSKSPDSLAYKQLGIKPGATPEQIKSAYRNNALKYSLDRAPKGREAEYKIQFIRNQAAYEKLVKPIEPTTQIKPPFVSKPGIPQEKAPTTQIKPLFSPLRPSVDMIRPPVGIMAGGKRPPATPTAEKSLIQETKGKTLEEFVEADLGSSYAEIKNVSPDEIVTIYRASEKGGKIKSGNFVTTNRQQASFYAKDIVGQRGAKEAKIVSEKVLASDIRLVKSQEAIGVDDAFIYRPKQQLTDIWNKAQETQILGRGDIYRISESTQVTNTQGKSVTLPKGEEYTVYKLPNNKVRLQDGKQVTVFEGELGKLRGQIIGEEPKAGGKLPKRKVKPTVRRTTGQYIPEEPTITESSALTQALKRESQAARLSKRETKFITKLIEKIKKSPIEGMNYEERTAIEELQQELKTTRTKEGLSNLYDKVKQLKDIGKAKYVETKLAEDTKFEIDRQILIKTINPVSFPKPIFGIMSERPSKIVEAVKVARAITLRPSRIFDALDGGQNFKGANHKYFMNRANDAEDSKIPAIDNRRIKMQQSMEQIGINSNDLMKSRVVGGKKFTVDEMISIYVAAQNREKALAVVYGNNISYGLMREVIAQMTPQEKALAEAIKTDYQDNYPRVRKALLDYTNGKVDMGKAKNYTPIRRTMQGYEPIEEELVKEMLERTALRKAYAEKEFTKERIKNIPKEFQRPIKLSEFAIWYEQAEKQEHFIVYGKLVKEMQRMINNKDYREAVKNKIGEPYNKVLQKWVNRIANPNIYKAYTQEDKIASTLRQNVALAYLGFNLLTIEKQFPSFFFFLEDVGPGPILASIHDLSTNYKENINKIHELAPQMKYRSIERELEEFKNRAPGRYRQVLNKIGRIGMMGIREMDKFVTHTGWLAVYNTGIREGMSETEAAREATMAVLRTQPAAHAKDIAGLYATNEQINWFTQFSNQLNQIYNIVTYDIPTQARTGRYKDALRTSIGVILGAASIAIISKGRLPKDKKEAIEMALEQPINWIPFFGRGISGMMKGFDFISVPTFAGAQRGAQAIMSLSKGKFGKALGQGAEAGAVIAGVPGFAQGRRTLMGIGSMIRGEAGPGALIYGPPKKTTSDTTPKFLKDKTSNSKPKFLK